MAWRISVDTGGTFTDVVVLDRLGQMHIGKARSTREPVFDGIETAAPDVAAEFGIDELIGAAGTHGKRCSAAVAVSLRWSIVDPAHERAVAALGDDHLECFLDTHALRLMPRLRVPARVMHTLV